MLIISGSLNLGVMLLSISTSSSIRFLILVHYLSLIPLCIFLLQYSFELLPGIYFIFYHLPPSSGVASQTGGYNVEKYFLYTILTAMKIFVRGVSRRINLFNFLSKSIVLSEFPSNIGRLLSLTELLLAHVTKMCCGCVLCCYNASHFVFSLVKHSD